MSTATRTSVRIRAGREAGEAEMAPRRQKVATVNRLMKELPIPRHLLR